MISKTATKDHIEDIEDIKETAAENAEDAWEKFHDRLLSIQTGAGDDALDAQTKLDRELEDIQIEFIKDQEDINEKYRDDEAKAAEAHAKNEKDRNRDRGDAQLDFTRRVEDINTEAQRKERDNTKDHNAAFVEIIDTLHEDVATAEKDHNTNIGEIQDTLHDDIATAEKDHNIALGVIRDEANTDLATAMTVFGENVQEGINTALDAGIVDAQKRYDVMVGDAEETGRRIQQALNDTTYTSFTGTARPTTPTTTPATTTTDGVLTPEEIRKKLGLATGGIALNPMMAIVGEAGPEAIIPLDRLGEFGGGGGITIMGDLYGWDDFVDKVGEAGIEIEERGG